MTERYTLGEVVKRTGARRRSIQLWADGGVLFSVPGTDRAGTGVHRAFEEGEVLIAALLVPLANLGTPIGMLRLFAEVARRGFLHHKAPGAWPTYRGADLREITNVLARARRGEGQNYLVFSLMGDGEGFELLPVSDEKEPVAIDPAAAFPNAGKSLIGILNLTALFQPVMSREWFF